MKISCLFFCFALTISYSTFGQGTNTAQFFFDNFEYEQAASLWEPLQNSGKLKKEEQLDLLQCYLVTEDNTKGLKLIENMTLAGIVDNNLGYFESMFYFKNEEFDKAKKSASLYRSKGGVDLPATFDADCSYSVANNEVVEGKLTQFSQNSDKAELLYRSGKNFILLKEMGRDSLLNENLGNTNFSEVFFLRPFLMTDGNLKQWNIFDDSGKYWSLNSIQIDYQAKKAYFSVTQPLELDARKSKSQLYEATFNGFDQTISDIKSLTFNGWLNTATSGQVALSPDGNIMVFSVLSDTATSADLAMATKTNGTWQTPVYLDNLNTNGEELFPQFEDENTFRYSTDGTSGFGQLDIIQMNIENGIFSNPIHIEKPLNSSADDFLLYGELADTSLFCSNRGAGTGDDDVWYFYPKIPEVIVPEVIVPVELPKYVNQRIYFDYKLYESSETVRAIADIQTLLNANQQLRVVLTGYTDPRGTDEYNDDLAMKRALCVKLKLVAAGIPESRIITLSQGERISKLSKHTLESQYAKDRFVEIELN